MSYNITALKVKSLDLTFPLTFDFLQWLILQPESVGRRWCLEDIGAIQIDMEKGTWYLPLAEHEISGVILDDGFTATKIGCRDDGSGYTWEDIILPLFKEFKGNLNAIVVWEGGDTVERVTITEGEYAEDEIE